MLLQKASRVKDRAVYRERADSLHPMTVGVLCISPELRKITVL